MRTGKGENRRDINISKCCETLGPERCKALLAFHVFTGCDQTGFETRVVLETFFCLLYKGNLNEINTLAKLRWFMFSRYQCNSKNLPPPFGALKYKIFCSHYVTLTLKCAVVSKQNFPSFLNYGWEIVEKDIMPILTDNLPVPLAIIELTACGYKTGCKTNHCKCRKNGFTCRDMCKCVQFENIDCWTEDKDNVIEEEADDDL